MRNGVAFMAVQSLAVATLAAVAALAAGGCSKDEAKEAAARANDVAGDVKAKAVDKASDLTAAAAEQADAVKSAALAGAADVKNVAIATAGTAADVGSAVHSQLASGYATGERVKAELDKVYKTAHDYDLAVDEVGLSTPAGESHASALAELPTVRVGDATIGYDEDVSRSVGGATYSKHFRASWRRGDKIIRVSYFTSERIDLVAFAALLQRIVPVVERVL